MRNFGKFQKKGQKNIEKKKHRKKNIVKKPQKSIEQHKTMNVGDLNIEDMKKYCKNMSKRPKKTATKNTEKLGFGRGMSHSLTKSTSNLLRLIMIMIIIRNYSTITPQLHGRLKKSSAQQVEIRHMIHCTNISFIVRTLKPGSFALKIPTDHG